MKNALEINNLRFSYDDNPVLNIKSFAIPENEVTALIGDNGSGKSTLLNLLACLDTPATGTMEISGTRVTEDNRQEIKRQIGLVQQNPYLFNMNVLDNVELGLKLRNIDRQARRERALNIIDQLDLSGLMYKRAHELSGGEIQKVAIARTLVLEPEIILMDEPFTYLDKNTTSLLEDIILNIRENRSQTVIFTSHGRMLVQRLTDHIYSMINGNLIPAHKTNIYSGSLDHARQLFDTGKIRVYVPGEIKSANYILIESTQIVLSENQLDSSMRNMFQGNIKSINEQGDELIVIVEAGERFEVIVTKKAMIDLGFHVGDTVWVSFKSSAVTIY